MKLIACQLQYSVQCTEVWTMLMPRMEQGSTSRRQRRFIRQFRLNRSVLRAVFAIATKQLKNTGMTNMCIQNSSTACEHRCWLNVRKRSKHKNDYESREKACYDSSTLGKTSRVRAAGRRLPRGSLKFQAAAWAVSRVVQLACTKGGSRGWARELV